MLVKNVSCDSSGVVEGAPKGREGEVEEGGVGVIMPPRRRIRRKWGGRADDQLAPQFPQTGRRALASGKLRSLDEPINARPSDLSDQSSLDFTS